MATTPATPASITSCASEPKARTSEWGSAPASASGAGGGSMGGEGRGLRGGGGAPGVEDEDGYPGRRQELPQRGAVHQLAVVFEPRVLEPEVAMLARARSGE